MSWQFEAEIVLNLFLIYRDFEARCYKIVLIKKSVPRVLRDTTKKYWPSEVQPDALRRDYYNIISPSDVTFDKGEVESPFYRIGKVY